MKKLVKKALNLLNVCFWGTFLAKMTLLGVIEVVLHAILRIDDWTLPMLWHLIFWGTWLFTVIAARIVKHSNKKK